MRLNYEILWFEDNLSWFNTSSMYIEEFLNNSGFELVTYQYENDRQGLEEIIKKHNFDLILMDYNLVGKNGDELIEKIRDLNIYTDIIFYSQNGAQPIRDIIRVKGIDGIFCSGRDIEEFEEKVNGVIGNTIKKVQDVNNIRGLVIAETIDLENILEVIIRDFFRTEPGQLIDQKKTELLNNIYTKKIE
ncbi:response regulator, partial [Bacillus sp. MM2020_1]|nr:response regulator [Bacillus sp. MM2020_1]